MEEESQNAQDARVERLWKSLHHGTIEPLDLEGLRAGLKKIGHPLGAADKLLKQVFEVVDTSKDGKIEYSASEFRTFIEHTEIELRSLFKSIDRDHNGRLDKAELHAAFKNADIVADHQKLDRFFDHIDSNHDGEISFEEWRNFLMFLPLDAPNLDVVLSYYNTYIFIGSEGDVSVHGNPGLGTNIILSTLFGSIFDLAHSRPIGTRTQAHLVTRPNHSLVEDLPSTRFDTALDLGEQVVERPNMTHLPTPSTSIRIDLQRESTPNTRFQQSLTDLLPDSGYFVAGGIAGLVSRTVTAPLDRLKVYLIAQTGAKKEAVNAVKSGSPVKAVKAATGPLLNACVELWRLGGVRSLFVGNGLNVLKVMPESAIKFGSYEGSKRLAARIEGHNNPRSLSGLSQFLAAGMGGVISQFAVYPLDTLKFRVQCETVAGGPRGNALIIQTARKMFVQGSIRSYYRGLILGLGGMFPYSAIDLTTYEYLKRTVTAYHVEKNKCSEKAGQPGRIMTGALGAVSSSFGATMVYPVNLIRTRIQSQGTATHPPTYTGWRDCVTKTIKGEGVKGLYKGLVPNLLKVVPSMSISYMVYEGSKVALGLK